MEAAALYGVAAEYDKQALAVLTVSDHLLDHSGDMSAAERETRFRGLSAPGRGGRPQLIHARSSGTPGPPGDPEGGNSPSPEAGWAQPAPPLT